MEDLSKLQQEIEKIKKRNQRVEADKAWETSWVRIILIVVITYIIITVVMYSIGVTNFYISSLIPTIAFLISIQSLPVVKKWWVQKYNKKKSHSVEE